ncbi:hypothetical protein P3X46_010616 [Hevea brasiliensis]|uniref:Uncharacterized protein n=1 Tax=Hevea brasiliensis TaxID=3981 RepID=A0ABQ9MEM3_HEVBR|nr:hypothetical protein P3X46_010616 [Hevea brasiliensis]
MAVTFFHGHSDSLPSRPHPLMSQLDDHICILRAFEVTSTSSMSISHKLDGLQDFHEFVDKLLLLPLTQRGLAQENNHKCVEELLNGSLRLLNVCNSAKDALLQIKEYTLELQSTIRRRQGGENGLAIKFRKYLTSWKMANRAIKKALTNLKGLENKCSFSCIDAGNEIATLVTLLREVQAITLHWSLVSKLILHKRIASKEEEMEENEFAMADAALKSLVGCKIACKYDNYMLMENVQSHLKNLEVAFKISKMELRASSSDQNKSFPS